MILISKAYKGYVAGSVIQLPTQEEAALVAQGYASVSAGPVTPGNVSTTATAGRVGIAAGASSVTITHPQITAESKVFAVLAQAAADATLLRVERILPANGSVTIYGTANATSAVAIDWMLLPSSQGQLPPN